LNRRTFAHRNALKASGLSIKPSTKKVMPIRLIKLESDLDSKNERFAFSGPLRPGKVSPRLLVPDHIKKPDWVFTGLPQEEMNSKFYNTIIEIKDAETI